MSTTLTNKLSEQWRDALVAYVTNHVMTHELGASSLNMITADHLYSYFLIDTQVSAEVKTSYLAEALACVQQYVNAVFNNIEPGYQGYFPAPLLTFWQQAMGHYSLWAGYQMLEDYPYNYIRADLRLNKTDLFTSLENELSQNKLTDAGIQNALLSFLKGYERQNSIRIISGYIDYIGKQHDEGHFQGYAFANSPCYLLGKNTEFPANYYWRKVDVRLDATSTYIQPDAWDTWQEIVVPDDTVILDARLVLFCGRLHAVFLHHGEEGSKLVNGEEQPSGKYLVKLSISYLGLDKRWSAAETLYKAELPIDNQSEPFKLLALALAQPQGSDDKLALCLAWGDEVLFHQVRDVLKRGADTLSEGSLLTLLNERFTDSESRVKLQHRLTNHQLAVGSITWQTKVAAAENQYLWLEAEYEYDESKKQHRLNLRGRCDKLLTHAQLKTLYLTDNDRTVGNADASGRGTVAVQGENGRFELYCLLQTKPDRLEVKLDIVSKATIDTFTQTSFGWFEGRAAITLDAAEQSALASATFEQIITGAGFSYQINAGDAQPLGSRANRISSVLEPIVSEFSLKNTKVDGSVVVPLAWEGNLSLNGGIATPWQTLVWEHEYGAGLSGELTFTFGEKGTGHDIGSNTFTLTLTPLYENVPFIEKQSSGIQFLLFNNDKLKITPVRLNSQQVQDLINRAESSPQAVFSWEAQHQWEPTYQEEGSKMVPVLDDEGYPALDLYGANGRYLYELFFHVPHLIASRLQDEGRFAEARSWLQLIFNPQQQLKASEIRNNPYWNCVLLLADDTPYSGIDHQLVDPHRMAYASPSYYRQAIFVQYVQSLIQEADNSYRQLTRDSLAKAWLLYQMAGDLMGEAPRMQTVNTWQPKRVSELMETRTNHLLQQLTENSQIEPANLPKSSNTFFWSGVAQHPAFTVPVNEHLLDIWTLIAQRFHNLRHYLTIDGYPLQIPLFAPPIDPFALLLAQSGGNAGVAHLLGTQSAIPPYRYRTLLVKAQEAVGAVIQFGEQLRNYMEMQDRTKLETLQYEQATEIGQYSKNIQEMLLKQQTETKKALEAQQKIASGRAAHYQKLVDEYMSGLETGAQVIGAMGSAVQATAAGWLTAAGLANTAPNIFGVANGGNQWGAAPNALATVTGITAGLMQFSAEQMTIQAQYQRRQQEWKILAEQAELEVKAIEQQINAQQYAVDAAKANLEHSDTSLKHMRQIYEFYQTKSTKLSLYQWLRSQTASLYKSLYDQTASLCKSVEACWEFETGNFNSRTGNSLIRSPRWETEYYGLTAGENLRMDLLKLDTEYTLSHERRLSILKTVSVKQLIEHNLVWKPGGSEPVISWEQAKESLTNDGKLEFELSHALFDLDYPGHYLRQIYSVAVSLPSLLGPYQNVKAIFKQLSSALLILPDIGGVRYLASKQDGNLDSLKFNLRADQKIALSGAIQDDGNFTNPVLDDRYFSFEGTGAVSRWEIQFPNPGTQSILLENLTDIIVEIRYLAKHGGQAFEDAVVAELASRRPVLPTSVDQSRGASV